MGISASSLLDETKSNYIKGKETRIETRIWSANEGALTAFIWTRRKTEKQRFMLLICIAKFQLRGLILSWS